MRSDECDEMVCRPLSDTGVMSMSPSCWRSEAGALLRTASFGILTGVLLVESPAIGLAADTRIRWDCQPEALSKRMDAARGEGKGRL